MTTKAEVLSSVRDYCLWMCGGTHHAAKENCFGCEMSKFQLGRDPEPNEARSAAARARYAAGALAQAGVSPEEGDSEPPGSGNDPSVEIFDTQVRKAA